MYQFTIEEVVDSHKLKLKAAEAFESVEATAKRKKKETMSNIVVYSKNNCTYCDKAKALVKKQKYHILKRRWNLLIVLTLC